MGADPSVSVDAKSSLPFLFSDFSSSLVSLNRALILGQEALLNNVRFRGWVWDPRTVLGEEKTGAHSETDHGSVGFSVRKAVLHPHMVRERVSD